MKLEVKMEEYLVNSEILEIKQHTLNIISGSERNSPGKLGNM